MFPKYPDFRCLTIEDKDNYNKYYISQSEPNSDYCFAVVQTWLAYEEPVLISQITEDLIIIKYKDVLFNDETCYLYAPIGSHDSLGKSLPYIMTDIKNASSLLILSSSQLDKTPPSLKSGLNVISDPGMRDYIYSVKEYSSLETPTYRRIRREMNTFDRNYPNTHCSVIDVDISDLSVKSQVINAHHCWEKTYMFDNDPLRIEGEILARIVLDAEKLGVNCSLGIVDGKIEGIFLFSNLAMKYNYINLHHARFSYNYKHINDYLWVLLAKHIDKKNIQYINFERDANIVGLRHHKELLKPKIINEMHIVS